MIERYTFTTNIVKSEILLAYFNTVSDRDYAHKIMPSCNFWSVSEKCINHEAVNKDLNIGWQTNFSDNNYRISRCFACVL